MLRFPLNSYWLWLWLALGPVLALAAGPSAYYDEVFDANGQVRPQYQEVYRIYGGLTAEQRKHFSKQAEKKFLGDQPLDSLPRVLTQSEVSELQTGVHQRGTALRLFLQDYYSGGTRFQKVIPPEVLRRIVERSGETDFFGKLNPKDISFPYGPDIIRDSSGTWRVLEDNPGNIGGPGDIIKGREILLEGVPAYKESLKIQDNPARYFKNLISRYKSARKPPNGKMVVYTLSLNEQSDKEDIRLRKIYGDLGVEYVTPSSKDRKLVVDASGVYLERRGPAGKVSREKVGFVVVNGDHKNLDYSYPSTREQALIEEAEGHVESYGARPGKEPLVEALKPDPLTGKPDPARLEAALKISKFRNAFPSEVRKRAPGLIQAILDGKVGTNYMPGVDFIGDKEFNAYVDDLVRLYLHEEPILKNIPSESFARKNAQGKPVLDRALFDKVFANKDQYVVKVVDGRGGEGIWVGPKVTQAEFDQAKVAIQKEPWRFRAQEYRHLSVLDDRIVDLRLISYVDANGVLICETPWGRAISMHGDGKVNISSNGFESPVIVVKDPKAKKGCIGAVLSGLTRQE